jgi:lysophospholipase L1-like esterase
MARGGRSSKSFIAEGLWKKCLDLKPDYVLIQFGHNDQPGHGADRETDPNTTYRQFMTQYVDDARAAGIKPVLITPMSRRQWGAGPPFGHKMFEVCRIPFQPTEKYEEDIHAWPKQ